MDVLERNKLPVEGGYVVGPKRLDRGEVFIREPPSPVEGDGERLELLFRPPHPDSKDEAAAAELVEVRDHARSLKRVPVGEDGDRGAKLDPGRDSGEPSESDERIIEWRRVPGVNIRSNRHMIRDHDEVKANRLRKPGPTL